MNTMKKLLEEYPQYREKLYIRGFLFTDAFVDEKDYPFYGKWKGIHISGATLLVHPQQNVYMREADNRMMCLIGHAFNPISVEAHEEIILDTCLSLVKESEEAFWNYFNELTGVFTFLWFQNGEVRIVSDASGMQTTFYSTMNGKVYICSHTMMLGELLNLEMDSYVKRLISYRFFPLLGNALPGDLTQFAEVKRITPNFCCVYKNGQFENRRYFVPYVERGKTREQLVDACASILHNSMGLIAKKWERPAISLTGGCDSRTTLACTQGLYDRFEYYSYNSSEAERVDCVAAATICRALNLPHIIYTVPEEVEKKEYDVVGSLLRWNCGDLRDSNPNDIRKRIILNKIKDFDVEVKSWASEIGRAYYSKRFHGRTTFPDHPSGRACTTLYKFFLHNRRLVMETDRVFERYIADYYQAAEENPIPWFEQFFWEYRVPAWNGLVITGEHRYSSDITIPYNNRRLLTLLLSVPIEDRINDCLYAEIRKKMNPKIDETGIAVTNLKHTDRRARYENLYWTLHHNIPI